MSTVTSLLTTTMATVTTAAPSTNSSVATTGAPPSTTGVPSPPADATESEFLIVALVTIMVLLIVLGTLILVCKRTVYYHSGASKRKRAMERKLEGEGLERKLWALVDAKRDEELTTAVQARLAQGTLGAGEEEAPGDAAAAFDDDDVDYAELCHITMLNEPTASVVSPEHRREAELVLREAEIRRTQQPPPHIPLSMHRVVAPMDFIRRTFTATRTRVDPFSDAVILDAVMGGGDEPLPSVPSPFVPPSSLPWLASGQGRHSALAWAEGLDLTATLSGTATADRHATGASAAGGSTAAPASMARMPRHLSLPSHRGVTEL
jgi:hypothetical protein